GDEERGQRFRVTGEERLQSRPVFLIKARNSGVLHSLRCAGEGRQRGISIGDNLFAAGKAVPSGLDACLQGRALLSNQGWLLAHRTVFTVWGELQSLFPELQERGGVCRRSDSNTFRNVCG